MSTEAIDCEYIIGVQTGHSLNTKKIFFIFFTEKERYESWLRDHGRRPETINAYDHQLNSIWTNVVKVMGDKTFDEIGEDEVFALLDSFKGVCENTKRTYLTEFGRFVEFVTGKNPVKECHILWNDSSVKNRKFIALEDWPRIKASARTSSDRLILYLGAYMGLRRAEITRIRLGDIDGDYLIIRGKGHGDGKMDRKFMPEPVQEALRDYLKDRRKVKPTNDNLLVMLNGPFRGKAMVGRNVGYYIEKMRQRSGVDFTPHSLRRLYATTMWEATGRDLAKTKQATRHVSTDILMNCYINVNPNSERAAVDNLLKMI